MVSHGHVRLHLGIACLHGGLTLQLISRLVMDHNRVTPYPSEKLIGIHFTMTLICRLVRFLSKIIGALSVPESAQTHL